jgi:SRSO17 transposase
VAQREGATVTEEEIQALLPALEEYHVRFHRFFCRSEGRELSRKYLMGLALPIERKNVENIAEQVGGTARTLQVWLSDSPWDEQGCIAEMQRVMGEQFGAPNGVLIFDDTGFVKKGTQSAGVGRQYSGTLGRTDNCQVGVFMGYASGHGHTLVDCRLYLLRSWLDDPEKRQSPRAAVPRSVGFKTKLEFAGEMLRDAAERGALPFQWVAGDAAYGDSHDLRRQVAELGRWYCFEVSKNSEVWTTDPNWQIPPSGKAGRPRSRPRPAPESAPAQTVEAIVRALPRTEWLRHRVTEGEKGPREYEFVRLRVVEKNDHVPGRSGWLMARRPVGSDATAEIKFFLSNAPETVALAEMAWVGCLRWTIEEDFELAKGEVGLDQYEVTKYRGWYHHMTMCLIALSFLKAVQGEWGKKRIARLGPRSASAA